MGSSELAGIPPGALSRSHHGNLRGTHTGATGAPMALCAGRGRRGRERGRRGRERGRKGREPGGAGCACLYGSAGINVMKQGHLGGAPGQTIVLRAHAGIISPLGWKAPGRRRRPHFHITLYF